MTAETQTGCKCRWLQTYYKAMSKGFTSFNSNPVLLQTIAKTLTSARGLTASTKMKVLPEKKDGMWSHFCCAGTAPSVS